MKRDHTIEKSKEAFNVIKCNVMSPFVYILAVTITNISINFSTKINTHFVLLHATQWNYSKKRCELECTNKPNGLHPCQHNELIIIIKQVYSQCLSDMLR